MSQTITLGGKEYPIASLSMQQMRTACPAYVRIGIDTPDGMAAQIAVIQAAMNAADPTITVEFVDNLRGVTYDELKGALGTIGEMLGFRDKKPGEVPAAKQSSGEISTD